MGRPPISACLLMPHVLLIGVAPHAVCWWFGFYEHLDEDLPLLFGFVFWICGSGWVGATIAGWYFALQQIAEDNKARRMLGLPASIAASTILYVCSGVAIIGIAIAAVIALPAVLVVAALLSPLVLIGILLALIFKK